jgi:Na+/H+ antiporter NhaC
MSTLLDALICPARTSQVAIVEVIKSMRLWRCKIEDGE